MPQDQNTQKPPRVQGDERDARIPGLVLRHRATRSSWHLAYRTKGGRRRNPKLGDGNVLSRTQAREIAREMLVRVAKGEDPEDREDHTVLELSTRYHEMIGLRKKTAKGERWKWDCKILPRMGSHPIGSLTARDLENFHHSMRETPSLANRVLTLLQAALAAAARWGWIDRAPMNVKPFFEKHRKRVPSPEETRKILAAAAVHPDPWFGGLIRLLVFTGARKSELLNAKRSDIDELGLHLHDSKTGSRVITLSTEARETAAAVPIQGDDDRLLPVGNHWAKWKAMRESIGIPDLTIHDLRRGYASAGVSAGLPLEQVMQLLGHTSAQTTKRYAYLHQEAATRAANATASAILKPATTT